MEALQVHFEVAAALNVYHLVNCGRSLEGGAFKNTLGALAVSVFVAAAALGHEGVNFAFVPGVAGGDGVDFAGRAARLAASK
jgi:hypothetical protein